MDELLSQRHEIFGTCGEEQKAMLQVNQRLLGHREEGSDPGQSRWPGPGPGGTGAWLCPRQRLESHTHQLACWPLVLNCTFESTQSHALHLPL